MPYREVKYKGEGMRNLNKRLEEIFRRGEEVIHFELISIEAKEVTITVDIFINDYLAANPKEQLKKGEVKNRDIFDQVEESIKP